MSMRTPLKNARRLGSAKEGANHFWLQRLTGAANLVLVLFLVWLIASLAGADHQTVKRTRAHPLIAIALGGLIISGTMHMRLVMQTIIEHLGHGEASKIVLLMLNTLFASAVALSCIYAILKLSFGA